MRRGAGQPPRIGARVGHLEEIILPDLLDPQDFLDLRFGLEGEILDGKIDYSADFFGKPAFLTVSGQLNGERSFLGLFPPLFSSTGKTLDLQEGKKS